MSNVKMLEIRDRATFIPALAVALQSDDEQEAYLLRRAGFPADGTRFIMLMRLQGGDVANYDVYQWSGRTWPIAHEYIHANWDILKPGDVIDVEFILGEKPEAKISERFTS